MDKTRLRQLMNGRWKARYLFPLVFAIAALLNFALLRARSNPWNIVSSAPDSEVSVFCSYGTNHMFYNGDLIDRMLDPIIRHRGNPNSYRFRRTSDRPSTMVWVRFKNPMYRKPPLPITTFKGPMPELDFMSPLVYARLEDAAGIESELEAQCRSVNYKEGYYITAWVLPRKLADHRGSELRITGMNGSKMATLRVP